MLILYMGVFHHHCLTGVLSYIRYYFVHLNRNSHRPSTKIVHVNHGLKRIMKTMYMLETHFHSSLSLSLCSCIIEAVKKRVHTMRGAKRTLWKVNNEQA
jgi:hypothetical protein